MRPKHGQIRLAWIGASALAIALIAGALLWAAAPHDDADAEARVAFAVSRTAAPAFSIAPPASLPAPEAAIEPPQPLTPPAAPARVARAEPAAAASGRASLDLTLLEPSGGPAVGVKMMLAIPTSKARITAVPEWSGPDGRIVLPFLPADVPLVLRFADKAGNPVLDPLRLTLAAGEHRVLSLTTSVELCDVVVEVRDRLGRPVQDPVDVTLVAAFRNGSKRSLQTIREQTSEGRVGFSRMAVESVSVTAQLDGFAPAWQADTPVDRDPLVVVLTLDPGFTVDVEIVDEHGRARDVDAVTLRGAPVGMPARWLGPGRFRFPAFPAEATGITVSAQGRHWSIDHDARQPTARIVVPAAGELSVSWDPLEAGCGVQGLFIYSEPPGWGWFQQVDVATLARGGPVLIDDLAPGDYRLEVPCVSNYGPGRNGRATVQSGRMTAVRIEP